MKSNLTKREEGLKKWNNMRVILNSFPLKRGYELCTSLYAMGIKIEPIDFKNYTNIDKYSENSDDKHEYVWDLTCALRDLIEYMPSDMRQFLESDEYTKELLSILNQLNNHLTEEEELPVAEIVQIIYLSYELYEIEPIPDITVWDRKHKLYQMSWEVEIALFLYEHLKNRYMKNIQGKGMH